MVFFFKIFIFFFSSRRRHTSLQGDWSSDVCSSDLVGTAKLSTVGAPTPLVSESQVKRADAPKVLEFSWGGQDLRWELEPLGGGGTRLTLWHNIDRGFISMGAAGWHICFDV